MSSSSVNGIVMALHPEQARFVASKALRRGLVAGRGGGKSFVASYDIIKKAKPDRLYMVAAPSYPMLRDATFRSFMHVGSELMNRVIKYRGSGGNLWARIATFDPNTMPSSGTAEVIFRTASDPDKLRGPNLSGVWMDEASVMKQEAFDIAMATLREGGDAGWVTLTFTPRGKSHWTYEQFYDKFGNVRPFTEVFHCKQSDNPMLNKTFVELMQVQYAEGSRLSRQELGGEFIDFEGLLFRREWFDAVREVPTSAMRVRAWDKAATSASDSNKDTCWTAGVLVAKTADNKFYIEDVVRGQWSYAERNAVIRQTAEIDSVKYNGTVNIWIEMEPGSGGKESAFISVSELAGHPVFLDRPQSDKATRAIAMSSQAEIGNVKIKAAHWTEAFLEEIGAFPEGRLKDQVDSAVLGFNKLALGSLSMRQSESLLVYPFPSDYQNGYIESIGTSRFEKNEHRSIETASLLNYLTHR